MLRFIDSFDYYATSEVGQKYSTVNFSPEITAGAGTCGTHSLQFNAFDQIVKGLPFTTDTVGYGHWLRINLAGVGVEVAMGGIGHYQGRHIYMLRFYDGSLGIYRNDAFSGISSTFLGATAADVVRVGDEY